MAAKKSFPGIFIVIIVTFAVYLTIVVGFIYMHYNKPAKGNAIKKINISYSKINDRIA
jgi:hypothetical protein